MLYEVSTVQLDRSAQSQRPLPKRVRQVGVPDVRAPWNPPAVTGMSPASGPAGAVLTFTGVNLAGWRASVVFLDQALLVGEPLTGDTFTATIPAGAGAGFYDVRVDVSAPVPPLVPVRGHAMTRHGPYRDDAEHLADELRRLDLLIRLRLAVADRRNEAVPHEQLARTVYITREEVDWLLAGGDAAGGPVDGTVDSTALDVLDAEIDERVRDSLAAGVELPLPRSSAGCSDCPAGNCAPCVICLAPELRRKYDRLYAYLQDDITRKRPSVDLVLELLCDSERSAVGGPPLVRGRRTPAAGRDPADGWTTRTARPARPGWRSSSRWTRASASSCWASTGSTPAGRPVAAVPARTRWTGRRRRWTMPASRPWSASPSTTWAWTNPDRRLVLALHGPADAGKRELAAAGVPAARRRAAQPGRRRAGAAGRRGGRRAARSRFAKGCCRSTAVHVAGAEACSTPAPRPLLAALETAVAEFGWLVFLTGESAWPGRPEFAGALVHPVGGDAARRRAQYGDLAAAAWPGAPGSAVLGGASWRSGSG